MHTNEPSDPVVSTDWANVELEWTKTARWLLLHGLVVTTLLLWPPLHWAGPFWFAASMFLISCIGVSVGMHRGVIHRAFAMPSWFRNLTYYLCTLTGMGGPTSFIRMHQGRDYHQDQPECPAFFGYRVGPVTSYLMLVFCVYVGPDDAPAEHPALEEVGWFGRLLDRTYLVAPTAYFALLWLAGGWVAVWWGGLLPWVAGQNLFWASNYICHTRGYVRFPRPGHAEHGYNQRILGFFSFGEGFHNNHHEFPWSARMGLGRDEVDLGWLVIRAMARMGIVREVRTADLEPVPPVASAEP